MRYIFLASISPIIMDGNMQCVGKRWEDRPRKKYNVVEEEIHVEILLSWSDTIWVETYIQWLLTVTTKSLITSV